MKKLWKNKTVWLAAAALLLVGITALPEAMAYFTTYAAAGGGVEVDLGFTKNEVTEIVNGRAKKIQLVNQSSQPEYVRVKVFSVLPVTFEGSSPNWSQGEDGYWYYKNIVEPEKTTEELVALITIPEGREDDFDVIVVEESVPVSYKEDGTPYADWTMTAEKVTMGEEAGE